MLNVLTWVVIQLLYLKAVVGVEEGLAGLVEHWDEEEAGVWAPSLEMSAHQAENPQEVLGWKNIKLV